jgi:hypothetical protein
MINWHFDGDEVTYKGAARILLFVKLSAPQNGLMPPNKVIAVVHPLYQMDPDPDSLLTFAFGDVLSETLDVMDAQDIAETAFILPCVEHPDDEFPLQLKDSKYFLIMPPRSNWKNIGL